MKLIKSLFVVIVAVSVVINIVYAYFVVMEAPVFEMHYRANDGHCEILKYKVYYSASFDGGCDEHEAH